MLLSCVACGTTGDTIDTTLTQTTAATEPESETEAMPAVEQTDYNGETFHMIGFQSAVGGWYYAKEYLTGGDDEKMNILNNTVYEMNIMVEDYLGVELTYENIEVVTDVNVMYNTVVRTMVAGDDDYQLCIIHPYAGVSSFITRNHALDFYELEALDLSRSYWNGDVMDRLSLNGHAYLGNGDICNYQLNMIYANRGILEDAGRKIPYDKVRDGTWTIDELITLSADLYRDNGDGLRNNKDVYGFAGLWDINGAAFLQAADIYVLSRNVEGGYELSMYGDRLIDYCDKLYKWLKDESTYIWNMKQWGDPSISMEFIDGQIALTQWALGAEYLDADFEYGMLPMPKYDVEQESYLHNNWGHNLIVPSTIQNKQMVGQVLEMMAYYSQTIVWDVYYNEILQLRVSERPDDREMVELICNTVTFDPGIAFCGGNDGLYNLVYITLGAVRDGNGNISSYYNSNERNTRRYLEKLMNVGR